MGLQTYKKLRQKLSMQISKHDFGSSSFEDCQNQLSQNIHVLKIARAVSLFGVLSSSFSPCPRRTSTSSGMTLRTFYKQL